MITKSITLNNALLPPGLIVNALVAGPAVTDSSWPTYLDATQLALSWVDVWRGGNSEVKCTGVPYPTATTFITLKGSFLSPPIVSRPGAAAKTNTGLAAALARYGQPAFVGPRFLSNSESISLVRSMRWVDDSASGFVHSNLLMDVRSSDPYILVAPVLFTGEVQVHDLSGDSASLWNSWLVDDSIDASERSTPYSTSVVLPSPQYLATVLDYFALAERALKGVVVDHKPVFNVAQVEENYELRPETGFLNISVLGSLSSSAQARSYYAQIGAIYHHWRVYSDYRPAQPYPTTQYSFVNPMAAPVQARPLPVEAIVGSEGRRNTVTVRPAPWIFTPGENSRRIYLTYGLHTMGQLPSYDAIRWSSYSENFVKYIQLSANLVGWSTEIAAPYLVGLDRFKVQQTPYPSVSSPTDSDVSVYPGVWDREWIAPVLVWDVLDAASRALDESSSWVGPLNSDLNSFSRYGVVVPMLSGAPIGENFSGSLPL